MNTHSTHSAADSEGRLDDLFLTAANGGQEELRQITRLLAAETPRLIALWPPEKRDRWHGGIELVLEAQGRADLDGDLLALIMELFGLGYESALFRDVAAAAARRVFVAYPDPAALISALGILNREIPTVKIAQHWELMTVLKAGVVCFHPTHGLGTLKEIDGFANSVHIAFAKKHVFPLRLALESLIAVRPGSALAGMLGGEQKPDLAAGLQALRRQAVAALVPAARVTDDILARLLIPKVFSESEWRAFLKEGALAAAPVEVPVAAGPGRAWHEARSLEELADLLAATERIQLTDQAAAALKELLAKNAAKADQANFLALALARLWKIKPADPVLLDICKTASAFAAPWQGAAFFAEVTDGLPGKAAQSWFEVTLATQGVAWLTAAAMLLPYRLFAVLGRVFEHDPDGMDLLEEKAVERILAKTASADVLLWLWKNNLPAKNVMADTSLVLKTLCKPVRGNYHKATKDLRKLLFDDEAFLRFLLHDGDPEAIIDMVACIRHVPLLDSGEQQSLLVRIVRVFPELKYLVEERQTTRSVRPLGRMTSPRSFELRRRELDELINVKIPANSRALGVARGYGDLRENAEFKAAKDEQRLLRIRRAGLERAIHEVRAFDFAAVVSGEEILPGCVVTLEFADGRLLDYTILGLWDADPARRFISYESPLGKVLLGHRAGEQIETPNGEQARVKLMQPLPEELHKWIRGEDLLA